MRAIPFPHAYWVISGKFLVGEYPGSKASDLAGFFGLKVSHIINLMDRYLAYCEQAQNKYE
jgi:hypothetical protein